MLSVKISDIQIQINDCSTLLKNELCLIEENFKTLRSIKQKAADSIETTKFELRQNCSPTRFFNQHEKPGNFSPKRISVKKLEDILVALDQYVLKISDVALSVL